MLRIAVLALALVLCDCERLPESYPPPPQRHFAEGPDAARASLIVHMNDPDAPAHFVRDISPDLQDGAWRWAGRRPAIKILLVKTTGLRLTTHFTLYGDAMRQTGPVSLSFFVNGHLLASMRYSSPGYKSFERPVPAGWLQTTSETVAGVDIDKLYTSPDGHQFGFILNDIGFEP